MTEKKGATHSDLLRVDTHSLEESDYAEVPELTDDWFARATPHQGGKPRGRPKAVSPKQSVSLRLSQRVLTSFRAGGPGWQTRINTVLEEWLDRHVGRS
jgi:uncharacterized protein (DUF4415 family)